MSKVFFYEKRVPFKFRKNDKPQTWKSEKNSVFLKWLIFYSNSEGTQNLNNPQFIQLFWCWALHFFTINTKKIFPHFFFICKKICQKCFLMKNVFHVNLAKMISPRRGKVKKIQCS